MTKPAWLFEDVDEDEYVEVTREEAHRNGYCMTPVECDRCCAPFDSWPTYMVTDGVWQNEAGLPEYGCMLCITCLEAVLRRPLTLADFPKYPCNDWLHVGAA